MLTSARGDGQMIHSLSKWIASIFVRYGESSEEDADIYAYGLEAVIAAMFNIIFGLIISFLLGRTLEGIIFISAFAALRKRKIINFTKQLK